LVRIDRGASGVASWTLPHSTPAGLHEGSLALSELREKLIKIVASNGLLELPEPVQLASGDMSKWFVDGKKALSSGADLELACRALIELANDMGVGHFDAVGGLTLGADQFSHGVAILNRCDWFVVRKAAKGRGTNKRIEGAELGPGVKVLLVDDVVTRGGSIQEAYQVISAEGATIVGAVSLIDRGGHADSFFADEHVPYRPLVQYWELGIPAVGDE
jgi:orotate phosphoribosyltransferase